MQSRESVHQPIVAADGVGWRIRNDRFESALSGLRLTAPKSWRFMVGEEFDSLDTGAEFMLANDRDSAYFTAVVERVSADKLEALAALTRQTLEEERGAPVEIIDRVVAGRKVEFHRYDDASLAYLAGVYVGDESVVTLIFWFPLSLADNSLAIINPVLAAIEAVPQAERTKLRLELLERAPNLARVADGRSYRDGVFVDDAHALRWTQPAGFWLVDDFDVALRHSPDTVLTATELDLGVHLAIEAFPSDAEAADTLANLIEGDELVSREVVDVSGAAVHRAQTVARSERLPFIYDIAVARRGPTMMTVVAWSADDTAEHRERMAAAIDAVEYGVKHEDPG